MKSVTQLSPMILLIITLLSIAEATAALCSKNVSTFTLEIRNEIADAVNDTSDMEDLQCVEAESMEPYVPQFPYEKFVVIAVYSIIYIIMAFQYNTQYRICNSDIPLSEKVKRKGICLIYVYMH